MNGCTHTSLFGNLIDLAFMSSPSQLLDCSVIPPIANSDHNGLKIRVNWKPSAPPLQSSQEQYGIMLMLSSARLENCLLATSQKEIRLRHMDVQCRVVVMTVVYLQYVAFATALTHGE